MSVMTVWDESDITRWPEDDDPESQVGEDDTDSRLSGEGMISLGGEVADA